MGHHVIMRTQGGAQTIANRATGIVCGRAIHGGGGGGGPESGTEPGECSASFVEKHFPEIEYILGQTVSICSSHSQN